MTQEIYRYKWLRGYAVLNSCIFLLFFFFYTQYGEWNINANIEFSFINPRLLRSLNVKKKKNLVNNREHGENRTGTCKP